jgi:hypothetical protein
VIYANGEPDDIPVRSEIRAGGETRPLDLRGFERAIRRIEMVYRSAPNFKGQATICVDGLAAMAAPGPLPPRVEGPGRPGGNWVRLGCRDVGFAVDRDVIRVGRAEGRFKAIRLRVSGNRVHMMDLRVIYANGEPDDIPVRAEIRAGGETRPLDLRGRERAIREIQMVYRSQPNFRGRATICVDGLD